MCGFTGFIDLSNFNLNYESILADCSNKISFRGPDQNNIYLDKFNKIFISFERLSFFDFSENAIQPMKSKNNRYIFLMNGEIYNYKELNKALLKNNIYTNEKSDTAVALEYISFFGLQNFLFESIGMFSMIIIDSLNKNIQLVSDQFLQKPLYYSIQNNILYFSSDIRTIHCHESFKKIINKNSVREYFTKSFISSPNTIYESVFKLSQANIISIDYSKDQIKIINKLNYLNSNVYNQERKLAKVDIDSIKSTIEDSVKLHLNSDAEIGTFLSSGIDSSIITSISSKHKKNLKVFSLGFKNNKNFDESQKAKEIANYLGADHHIKFFDSKNICQKVLNTSEIFSEPFSDSSQILFSDLCEFASNSVKGILSGDGADEIFGGYHRHLLGAKIFQYSRSNLTKKLFTFILKILDNTATHNLLEFIGYRYPQDKLVRLKKSIFAKDINSFYNLITSYDSFINLIENINDINDNYNFQDNLDTSSYLMWLDLTKYLPNDLLVKSDRCSMFHSLEVRSPFLNRFLVKDLNNISSSNIFKNNTLKYILKLLAKNYIPNKLISKKKKGFNSPIREWITNDLKDLTNQFFSKKMLSHNLFNNNLISKNIFEFNNGKSNHNEIWSLLIFQIWFNNYH